MEGSRDGGMGKGKGERIYHFLPRVGRRRGRIVCGLGRCLGRRDVLVR